MLLAAFAPALYAQVGLYVKLIVAFAIIISRLEVFASRQPLVPSFWDAARAWGSGSCSRWWRSAPFRELLGNGSLRGRAARARQAAPVLRAAGGRVLLDRAADGALQPRRAADDAIARRGRPREARMRRERALLPDRCRRGAGRVAARAASRSRPARARGRALAAARPDAAHPRARASLAPDQVRLQSRATGSPASIRRTSASSRRAPPTSPSPIREVRAQPGGRVVADASARALDPAERYRLEVRDPPLAPRRAAVALGAAPHRRSSPRRSSTTSCSRATSGSASSSASPRKRDTALGMGITFTLVMVAHRRCCRGALHVRHEAAPAPVPPGAGVHRRGGVPGAVARHRAQEDAPRRCTRGSASTWCSSPPTASSSRCRC